LDNFSAAIVSRKIFRGLLPSAYA